METFIVKFLRNRNEVFGEIKDEENLNRYIVAANLTTLFFCAIYGAIMGLFAGGFAIIMDMIKIPLLFLIPLLTSSLVYFVIGALVGLKTTFKQMFAILSISFAIAATVLVSFTPIVFVYSVSENSHTIMHSVHYILFFLSGLTGVYYLFSGMSNTYEQQKEGRKVNWLLPLIFGGILTLLVGIKLVWMLKPYFHYHQYFFEGLGLLL